MDEITSTLYYQIDKLTTEEVVNIKDHVIKFINDELNYTNVCEIKNFLSNELYRSNVNLIFLYGFFIYHGIETFQDYNKAFIYFNECAKKNHRLSYYYVATCYEYGHGVLKNLVESYNYYKKLADEGFAIGQVQVGYFYQMGYHLDKDYVEAENWYTLAIQKNNLKAKYNLGLIYLDVDKNEAAFKLFQDLEKKNYIYGTYMSGYCYHLGLGVEKNESFAASIYKNVINNNVCKSLSGKAYFNLAQISIKKNETKLAISYCENSARLGNSDAKSLLRDFNTNSDECQIS